MLCIHCKEENIRARGIDKCHAIKCNNYKNVYYEFCKECAEKSNRCECCGALIEEPNNIIE